ncbi:uncharacterized protein PHA67_017063 [Liasis olivaceus]
MDLLDTFLALFWIMFLAGRLLRAVDPPPSHPRLSIHPPYNSFLLEQCFSLTCSPPQNQTVYFFHETTTDGAWVLMKTQSGNTLKVCIRHLETEKKYACHYMEGNNGGLQNKSSSLSNEIKISILDRLPAPILSLDPHQLVYNPGQQVRLICSASEWPQLSEYQVHYKDPQYETKFRKIYLTSNNTRQHNIVVEKDTAGEYRCQYWIVVSGQEICSPWSKLVSVAMTDLINFNLLAVGCAGSGILILLVCFVCLYKLKHKGKNQTAIRAYWKPRTLQQTTSIGRNEELTDCSTNFQEEGRPEHLQRDSLDWGVLPKNEIVTKKKRAKSTDPGADNFPTTEPVYTLLGSSCSTFLWEAKN